MMELIYEKIELGVSVMRSMRIPVRAVWRSSGPRLGCQEVLIDIGLMCQVQALLANMKYLILGAVDSGQIELDWDSLLLNKTQRALHLIHLARGSDSNGYKHFLSDFLSAVPCHRR